MNRFDRRLKGVNNKSNSKPGSGAACVPQPLPQRAPLLSGMMFGGRTVRPAASRVAVPSTETTLDNLVSQVNTEVSSVNNPSVEKMSGNSIEMLSRRISRLENKNNVNAKASKAYDSLDKRLTALEKMYSDNMENMEKYVRNQEDRINLLTADYRKTLDTLNTIIRDVNNKIIELDETVVKKPKKEEKLEEVKLEEPPAPEIVTVRASPVIKKEETNDEVISEVTEEILNKVSESEEKSKKQDKNVSLMIVEKEVSNEN